MEITGPHPALALTGLPDVWIHHATIRGGLEAEGCPKITIGPAVRVVGGRCNIHLTRCPSAHIHDATLANPRITARAGDEHGKHILLDACDHSTIEDVTARTNRPSGDGVNVHASMDVAVRRVTVSGPKRRDTKDIAVPFVFDARSANCTAEDLVARGQGPGIPAMTVLGRGHLISNIKGGKVQVSYDGAPDTTEDIEIRGRVKVWADPATTRRIRVNGKQLATSNQQPGSP